MLVFRQETFLDELHDLNIFFQLHCWIHKRPPDGLNKLGKEEAARPQTRALHRRHKGPQGNCIHFAWFIGTQLS